MQSLFPRLRQLILPFFALPNDPAIIIGPDLPPCMQARYSAAVFYRPPGTVGPGIAGRPYQYRAQVNTASLAASTNIVEEGWLIYDSSNAICGYMVYQELIGANNGGTGAITTTLLLAGQNTGGGGVTAGNTNLRLGNSVNPFDMSLGSDTVDPAMSAFRIDGHSVPRGLRTQVNSTVNTPAIGGETVVLTTPAMTFYQGRAYEFLYFANILSNLANNECFMILRRNNIAGAIKFSSNHRMSGTVGNTLYCAARVILINLSGAAITDNFVLTQQTLGGGTTTAQGGGPRYLEIYDCGDGFDYLQHTQI